MRKRIKMDEWIYPKDLAEGTVLGLPKMSITLQNNIRRLKKITYTKLGRNCVYRREWIETYLNSNIRKASPKVS